MTSGDTGAVSETDDRAPARVERRDAPQDETVTANRGWWDAAAVDYQQEHGAFLGDAELVWGPEGWTEEELRVLGPAGGLRGLDVLEFGGGGAQGARWCAAQGARVLSTDLSAGMLAGARRIDAAHDGPSPLLAQADATRLPLADASMDVVFSAYGAVPFVADARGLMAELARVLRPGGRLACSTSHPIRWAFPDVPGEAGLGASGSYFDESPYVEEDAQGRATYVEHHRTLGHRVADLLAAGLVVTDVVEPPWPERNTQTWGGWSPLRGAHLPGTLILAARKP